MSWFPIISGIILIIAIGIFMSHYKKEEVKIEEVKPKEGRPVIIELFPKGTSNNPFVCKINSEVALEVKGYSDYKKENEVVLNNGYCSWHKSCPVGSFAKEYGITNTYYTPSVKGERDIWCRYNDGKLNSSAGLKLKVEV
jgi:hypothetical protein